MPRSLQLLQFFTGIGSDILCRVHTGLLYILQRRPLGPTFVSCRMELSIWLQQHPACVCQPVCTNNFLLELTLHETSSYSAYDTQMLSDLP